MNSVMEAASGNFSFLSDPAPRLARLGALAEQYFVGNAPTALVKLRQLGEVLAKDVAACGSTCGSPPSK